MYFPQILELDIDQIIFQIIQSMHSDKSCF